MLGIFNQYVKFFNRDYWRLSWIPTDEVITFLSLLHENFNNERLLLLKQNKTNKIYLMQALPTSIKTKEIRDNNWEVK
jgi:malate synthase